MKKKFKVLVVLPAYNAAETLRWTFCEIPDSYKENVILVDDFSSDETVLRARELGIDTFLHHKNSGYGANQKTCYKKALSKNADIIVMLHPDYQYDPKKIPELIQPILDGQADVVLGSRIGSGFTSRKGMPWWKYFGNRFLTWIENLFLRQDLSEYHTGLRAFSADVLRSVKYCENSDDFVFDTQILIQSVAEKFRIHEIIVEARYFPEASSISFWRSLQYGLGTLYYLMIYKFHELGFVRCRWL